jgi:hypothetical protein
MRSDLIFKAASHESNRYLLARLAARATRILHWPNTRIADTMNMALERMSECAPASAVTTVERKL